MKRKFGILIVLSIIILILIGIILNNFIENENLTKVFFKQEAMEDSVSTRIKVTEVQEEQVAVTVVFENPIGISEIQYPNEEMKINCNGKTKVAIDYIIKKDEIYVFDITSTMQTKIQKEISFKDIEIIFATPTIKMWPDLQTVKKGRQITLTAEMPGVYEGEVEYIWEGREKETSSYEVGTHTVRVKAVDKNGNESKWASKTFKVINTEIPRLSVQLISGNNFNILGNGNQTTYRNIGYTTVFVVNGQSTEIRNGTGSLNQVNFSTQVKVIEDNNYAQIVYNVTNNSNENKTISIATHADIMINSDDRARIDNVSGDKGFIMTDGTYYYNVVLRGYEDVTDVDSYWFGFFNDRQKNLWNDNHPQSLVNVDSGMVYSWKNRIIAPGETKSFCVKIGLE